MKKILLLTIGMMSLLSRISAQCSNSMCVLKSDIRGVKIIGAQPDKVVFGRKSQVVVDATNTGTCTWVSGMVFMRVTVTGGPSGSSGYQRYELAPKEDLKVGLSVERGGGESFMYDIEIDPKNKFTPGTYTLKFTLVCKGQPFGEAYTKSIEVVDPNELKGPCKMAATLNPSDVKVPAKLMAGKRYPVLISADNTGSCTWEYPKNKIQLRVKCLSWPTGANAEEIDKMRPDGLLMPEELTEVEAGQGVTFKYDLNGAGIPGRYVLEFQLLDNGKPFGPRCQKEVEVIGDPKRCEVEGYFQVSGMPSEMTFNKEYSVTLRVQNTGICEWVPASRIELRAAVTQKPSGSPSSLPELTPQYGIYPVGSNTIAPGKYFEVRLRLKGPYMPGSYELTWELYKEGSRTGIKEEKSFKVVAPR